MIKSSVRAGAFLTLAIVAVWLNACFSTASAAVSDNVMMHETFQQFDQTLDAGWRTLQLKRDYLGAAASIKEYMTIHSAKLKPWQTDSLAFHLGHVYAMADKRHEAITWLRKSTTDHLMGNSAYVNAYIAFLENNKPELLAARHTIATTDPGPWRVGDLREVDAMLGYFGDPFEAAWGALNCHNHAIKENKRGWTSYCKAINEKYRGIYKIHGIK